MNTAEIVIREVQGNGGFEVRQLLAVGVRQARQSAKLHPHGEVLPLYVTSRNVAHARIPDSHLGYNLCDSWWGVPPFVMLPEVTKQLDELSEVHIQPKDFRNGLGVEVESVSGQLDLLCQSPVQIANETHGVCNTALPDAVGRNEFRIRILSNKNPLVADLRSIVFAYTALLLADKTPDFVALHIAAIQLLQSRIQQSLASFANGFEKAHDRGSD